jgi:hypothetical protein
MKYVCPVVSPLTTVPCAAKLVQKMLVEAAQVPERTSSEAAKRVVRVRVWVVPLATKLYQTSVAVVPKPQPVVGGSDWVAPCTEPLVGVVQVGVTGTLMAWAQSSLVAVVGPLATHRANVLLMPAGGVAPLGYTRMK